MESASRIILSSLATSVFSFSTSVITSSVLVDAKRFKDGGNLGHSHFVTILGHEHTQHQSQITTGKMPAKNTC